MRCFSVVQNWLWGRYRILWLNITHWSCISNRSLLVCFFTHVTYHQKYLRVLRVFLFTSFCHFRDKGGFKFPPLVSRSAEARLSCGQMRRRRRMSKAFCYKQAASCKLQATQKQARHWQAGKPTSKAEWYFDHGVKTMAACDLCC